MPYQGLNPPGRKKAFRPKTITGCKTCRIRRIKCDEAEPSCTQCQRGRRVCDGYPNKALLIVHQSSQDLSSLLRPPLSPYLLPSKQERRCFDFFRHRTVPQLTGPFESPFWDHLLLQATHHEPALQHAAVALGALHERYELRSSNLIGEDHGFALQQYVKAIEFVTAPIRDRGKLAADVALMTCVLFVCFETLRGHLGVALSHIDAGVNIVSELQSTTSSESNLSLSSIPYAPLPVFNQIFSRLDAQASQIAYNRRRRLLRHDLSTNNFDKEPNMPLSFPSLEAARNELDYIHACATRTAESLPRPPPVFRSKASDEIKISLDLVRNSSLIRLKQWSSAFENFVQSKYDWTETEQRAVGILKLHRVMMKLTLDVAFGALSDELVWDGYFEEFESLVLHAEEVLQLSSAGKEKPSFTLDGEVNMALFFVAVKCRHSELRWKAIALLRSKNRQEGMSNSLLTADVAERLVQIEEEGLNAAADAAALIPRWSRVLGVEVRFDSTKPKATLRYLKLRQDGAIEKVDEWLVWATSCSAIQSSESG